MNTQRIIFKSLLVFFLTMFIYGCGGSSKPSGGSSKPGSDLTAGNGYDFNAFTAGSTTYETSVWAAGTGLSTSSIRVCDPKIKESALPGLSLCIEVIKDNFTGTEAYLLKEFYADVDGDGKADGSTLVTTNAAIWFDSGTSMEVLEDKLIAENTEEDGRGCRQVINTGQGTIIKSLQKVCTGDNGGLVRTYTSQGVARNISDLDNLIAELDAL